MAFSKYLLSGLLVLGAQNEGRIGRAEDVVPETAVDLQQSAGAEAASGPRTSHRRLQSWKIGEQEAILFTREGIRVYKQEIREPKNGNPGCRFAMVL